jgi:hypothetical protein
MQLVVGCIHLVLRGMSGELKVICHRDIWSAVFFYIYIYIFLILGLFLIYRLDLPKGCLASRGDCHCKERPDIHITWLTGGILNSETCMIFWR